MSIRDEFRNVDAQSLARQRHHRRGAVRDELAGFV